jgi:tetratricopeptide (TPR) repeat protein
VDQLPGKAFRYSGGGYTVAQVLMGDAAAQPFPRLMQQRVLAPLGMVNSTYEQQLPPALLARAAAGVLPDGSAVAGKRHRYPEMAAAGLWTTSQDLARFAVGVQQALRGDSKLVSAALARDMLTERAGSGYGLGFGVPQVDGEAYFSHGGWDEGFCATVMGSQRVGQGVAIMINANQPALMYELQRAVAHEYRWPGFKTLTPLPASAEALEKAPGRYRVNAEQALVVTRQGERLFIGPVGEPARELVPVAGGRYLQREQDQARSFEPDEKGRWRLRMEQPQGAAQVLPRLADQERMPRELLLAGDQAAALAAYRALRDGGDEAASEAALNQQAYTLLRRGEKGVALALMQLNTQLYPESANTWDGLGEVQLAQANREAARAAYRKALALQPNMPSAQAAMRKLGE